MLRNAAGNAFAWWVMGIAAVLLVICLAMYAIRFPHLSDCPDDWAAFGSYLAGVSALIVGFATVLLLLHNVRLLREQVDVSVAHSEKQDQLIAAQQKALTAQDQKERSAETERAIGQVIEAINRMEQVSQSNWRGLRDTLANAVVNHIQPEGVVAVVRLDRLQIYWSRQEHFPALVRLRGLLGELQERFSKAEREGIASDYWAAWIAGSLPATAISFLCYVAKLERGTPLAEWVLDQAMLRYATKEALMDLSDADPSVPLPFPVPPLRERQSTGNR